MSVPPNKIINDRRDYNTWVATETLEDYALRFAPKSFRKWPEWLVANTAAGGLSFLALEAIGGSLAINYGFANSFWAILTVGVIIFLTGLPIAYYAAKYHVDIDLLTRGAGFGYIGSTLTSLIYASFTFIFFALEAAIMAQALELYFHLPLFLGYVLCSIVIIPLAFFGVTLLNQLQLWSQPIWLTLMLLPYFCILLKEPATLVNWIHFAGIADSARFNPLLFGAAATVSFSLIAQIGEQVDFLRFLPDPQPSNRRKWWSGLLLAGPGWVIIGCAKQLGGAFLASIAIQHGVSILKANEPTQMYLAGFQYVFANPDTAIAVTILFVILSQIKINVTNAYAGSLAWSNFFSRLTHSHPGRVVWLVFNVGIALLMMELGVFSTLEAVLGLYSNVAIAWVGALVADLVINKPLGLSPPGIEFKRAHLYNFNPVGVGSTLIASLVAMAAFLGRFGPVPQAFASFIALGLALLLAPAIALLTQGKYYIARDSQYEAIGSLRSETSDVPRNINSISPTERAIGTIESGTIQSGTIHSSTIQSGTIQFDTIQCCICEQYYELPDSAFCPIYDGAICSLCCSLDACCQDACKSPLLNQRNPLEQRSILSTTAPVPARSSVQQFIRDKFSPHFGARVLKYLGISLSLSLLVGMILGLVYYQQSFPFTAPVLPSNPESPAQLHSTQLSRILIEIYAFFLVLIGIGAWWLVLTQESRQLAQEELDKRNLQLQQEVQERQIAEARLQEKAQQLEQTLDNLRQAEAQLIQTEKMAALGGLVAGIAHEINTPIGIGVTAASFLVEKTIAFSNLFHSGTMKRSDLQKFLGVAQQSSQMTLSNLNRAAELIQSFKQIAVDQSSESRRVFNLADYLEEILLQLSPKLNPTAHQIIVLGDRHLTINSYPGAFSQILTNLLLNSLVHAYAPLPDQPITNTPSIDASNIERLNTEGSNAKGSNTDMLNTDMLNTDMLNTDMLNTVMLDIEMLNTETLSPAGRIILKFYQTNQDLILEYSDDGSGILPEHLSKIFEPFFTTKRGQGGSGLGLHIVYNLVTQKLGGTIRCDSQPGQGTKFTIEVPSVIQQQQ